MKLVFINPLGKNYKGDYNYEFLFTTKDEIEAGDGWGDAPASAATITPPPEEEIDMVGTLTSKMELDLAIQSDYFSFNDAIEKIVAIGWQRNHEDHEERVVFHVEDSLVEVQSKLYKKDLKLTLQKNEKDGE